MKPTLLQLLWLIPALPLLAAASTALLPRERKPLAASLAIGSMALSLGLSLLAFSQLLGTSGGEGPVRLVHNFPWFQAGAKWVELGWVLDPLTASMLVMISLVGLLIFIYSVGYMATDENFTRFFCFLSLFAAAMLGLVIANSLLLLFVCWELVGLASYLLIGFWFHKPSAAAAAKKAFITTRIGDLAFLLGMVWLYAETSTLLFYNHGAGCLEDRALAHLVQGGLGLGLATSTAIGLLIFAGAMGKSGQVPLHVWLPDAMEGPTPVSALIHAATMVAAGVFLVARAYPLMAAQPVGAIGASTALQVISWVGVITAVLAATIAVAQYDIKRILAYSTVSQLGFMMLGLGTGGVAVGMFHLITHAFFKALLFLGAGSVIHGCHEEQDIRQMGGLRKFMPVTFATYAVGMLALSGFPLFSGFWSKDAILHAAHGWSVSHLPFYLGLIGAFLTAFYMTRQVVRVFYGQPVSRAGRAGEGHGAGSLAALPHESPAVMVVPLLVLGVCAVLLGFLSTPAWPWFENFLEGKRVEVGFAGLFSGETLGVMLWSSALAIGGLSLGWWVYHSRPGQAAAASELDPLETWRPDIFGLLHRKYYFDEVYEWSVVRLHAGWAKACDWADFFVAQGSVQVVAWITVGLSWVGRAFDEYVINLGFDQGCRGVRRGGGLFSAFQNGRVQRYLRVMGLATAVVVLGLLWGYRQ